MYIPRLMCTQHPDSTIKVSTAEEVEEAAVAYLAYGCDEVVVDYEGKATLFVAKRHCGQGVKPGHSAGGGALHHAEDTNSSFRGF